MAGAPNTALNGRNLDRMIHAAFGRLTQGLSPAALTLAYLDWLLHLSIYPGRQARLIEKALRKAYRLARFASRAASDPTPCIEPLPQDQRFADPSWQQWPFNLIYQGFLLTQQWWHSAATDVHGVTRHHQDLVTFATRQWLDMFSPSNFLATNPEVLHTTFAEGGMNLVVGAQNFVNDWLQAATGAKPERGIPFKVGKDVAVTPGKVVFRNRLIELIQYSPTTQDVYPEPLLIVPSWIMKYYILDLSSHNSLVRYLVGQGHTVFMISWKNPGPDDRELGMKDYLKLGPLAALDVVSGICPKVGINAVGYCLGGTLLSIAAAKLARDNDTRLNCVTLLAAETDFEEPGELRLFIDEGELAYLEDIMWDQGYLDGKQMGGSFALLNSRDLVWSRMVHDYLMGVRQSPNDLMAWNADTTRMPYRMHTEYLKSLYLNNDLAHGAYRVDGRPVALTDIRAPLFVVGTVKDHVSPWSSVYKIHLLTDTEVTFLLTSGGHNAGIVSEPGHPGRTYQMTTTGAQDKYVDPDTWLAATPRQNGSWWPAWQQWLAQHSGKRTSPPAMGAPERGCPPIDDAPGTYVLAP
jgi:polyhydroxyalkanoate synthase